MAALLCGCRHEDVIGHGPYFYACGLGYNVRFHEFSPSPHGGVAYGGWTLEDLIDPIWGVPLVFMPDAVVPFLLPPHQRCLCGPNAA
jgi:hypothetical protein